MGFYFYYDVVSLWHLILGKGISDDKTTEELIEDAKHPYTTNSHVLVEIGRRYFYGEGVKQDYKEAIKWFTKSTNEFREYDRSGEVWLGKCYLEGKGVPQDKEKAFQLFHEASRKLNSEAQLLLGDCYYHGDGTEQNLEEAAYCYKKAAIFRRGPREEAYKRLLTLYSDPNSHATLSMKAKTILQIIGNKIDISSDYFDKAIVRSSALLVIVIFFATIYAIVTSDETVQKYVIIAAPPSLIYYILESTMDLRESIFKVLLKTGITAASSALIYITLGTYFPTLMLWLIISVYILIYLDMSISSALGHLH